jgi:hypothetical protein
MGHAGRNSAQRLDAFCNFVDQVRLLTGVFVEEQVELVKGRPAHLPMTLLVKIAQSDRVNERLVEKLHRFTAHFLGEAKRQLRRDVVETLCLRGALM